MTEHIRAILDAVTARVLAYRPPEAEAKHREREKRKIEDTQAASEPRRS